MSDGCEILGGMSAAPGDEPTEEERAAAMRIYEESYDSLLPKFSMEAIARALAIFRKAAYRSGRDAGYRAGVSEAIDVVYRCPEHKCDIISKLKELLKSVRA